MGILIPKVVAPANLDKFRGIACLSAARKLFGYLWMHMLPPLQYVSFQTGFVKGRQAADGIFALRRAAELGREWSQPLFVVQLDLSKAFDRVKHSAVIKALKLQGCSLQCVAVLCALYNQSEMSARLGHVEARAAHMHRGLPQGAPESPLVFTLVTECVLRPLLASWRMRGSGWKLDDFWLPCVCFADDILLASGSMRDLERMVAEVIRAFADVGLDVSASKCHWTSSPAQPDACLDISGFRLQWEKNLTFVGSVVDLNGNDGEALEHRLTQARKAFHKWQPVLQARHASVWQRLKLAIVTVFTSALWLSSTWNLTKQQSSHLDSWGARLVARVVGLRRAGDEDFGRFWRRMHRVGHNILRKLGGGMVVRRLTQLHAYAGHAARSTNELLYNALRTRCLAWWRYQQALYESKRNGVHPKRFKAWRWEAQVVAFYGEAETEDVTANAGWMRLAQSREAWRSDAERFAHSTGH